MVSAGFQVGRQGYPSNALVGVGLFLDTVALSELARRDIRVASRLSRVEVQLSRPAGRLCGMRRTGPLLLTLAMIVVAHLWVPQPVAACSCVAPMDVIESAGRDPGSAVFTATAGVRVGDSIPVAVTRWFKGLPPIGPAILEGSDPLDMCGSTSPPAGGEYLFVTYTSETSRLAISGCSVQADITGPEGAATLARAIQIYGSGAAPPTDAPTPTSQPSLVGGSIAATILALAVALIFGLGVVVGLVALLRRRSV